jgi:hypothetical protein
MGVPWRTRDVVVGIVLVAVAALLVAQAIVLVVGLENPALITWLTSIALGVVIFAIVWLLALRPHQVSLSSLGLTPLGVPGLKIVGMTVGVLLLSLGSTALYAVLVRLGGLDILVPPEIPPGIVLPGSGAVLTFLALALWTPLSEEVFFRGFIFAGLSSRWGTTGAMLISAAIFSAFHISFGVLIPIFITGLLLAWLYRQTGCLWACIAAHAGQNAAALIATMYGV